MLVEGCAKPLFRHDLLKPVDGTKERPLVAEFSFIMLGLFSD